MDSAQYRAPGAQWNRFPVLVLVLVHGLQGSRRMWIDLGGMSDALEQLIALGAARPFSLVIPEICPGGVNTDCSNTAARKVADWLARQLRTLREPAA
ncbi:hypothetical protein AQI88_38530 [Streptomyces cellostaticus]|uniref:Esterase n=1 Tax=Streptomyces cellostaticus TaxID=67285 RepID=A0A101NDE8_9ACTN|nr:hypothetical protein [Streptomyces cellostaticus]KUM91084.1 hypothetical protein AQI88_38530 [Streptomyces cellostaticus]GHI01736.1 hypothetical protein Scel_00570 [Streptomyces cellostaticus]